MDSVHGRRQDGEESSQHGGDLVGSDLLFSVLFIAVALGPLGPSSHAASAVNDLEGWVGTISGTPVDGRQYNDGLLLADTRYPKNKESSRKEW